MVHYAQPNAIGKSVAKVVAQTLLVLTLELLIATRALVGTLASRICLQATYILVMEALNTSLCRSLRSSVFQLHLLFRLNCHLVCLARQRADNHSALVGSGQPQRATEKGSDAT
jgi:hypothetical protein